MKSIFSDTHTPPSPALRRRALKKRIRLLVLFLLFALLLSWRPCNLPLLFRALPEDALLTSSHNHLASGWHHLVRHPMLLDTLRAAGVPDPESLAEETEGFYQTLFWLTGSKTTLALSVNDRTPESFPDLPSLLTLAQTDPSHLLPRVRVSGASYVGWKRRPMELLWRIRYVPGLGRLNVTENGTRYLVFKHSKHLRRNGLVLSLDMVQGHLLAVLSTDPDAVRDLVSRATHPSSAPTPAWPRAPHTLSLHAGLPSGASLSFDDLSTPHQLSLRLTLTPQPSLEPLLPPSTPPAQSAVNAWAAFRPSPTNAPLSVALYDEPYRSTFCGFSVPGAVAFIPPSALDPHALITSTLDSAFDASSRPTLTELDTGLSILDFRPLFGKHSPLRPAKNEQPFLFLPQTDTHLAILGSCLSSYQRLAADPSLTASLADTTSYPWSDPSFQGSGWVRFAPTTASLRNVTAILSLAASFNLIPPDARASLHSINQALSASNALGSLSFLLYSDPAPTLHATFSREP